MTFRAGPRRPGSPERPGRDCVFSDAEPLYAFGHGLSYTEFTYSSLEVSPAVITTAGTATVRLRVCDSGNLEVV